MKSSGRIILFLLTLPLLLTGLTPQDGRLISAAASGNVEQVRAALKQGAQVNAADVYGYTPLNLAAYYGHEAVVRLLVREGGSIYAATEDGWTPLHSAARFGHEAVVRLLVEKGAFIEAADKERRRPLHLAALAGREAVVRLLVEKGASIDAATEVGWTPLHVSARYGHEAVVRVLLENGADIATRDKRGETPLHDAARGGHAGVVRLLLAHDAYVGVKDSDGLTPLEYARQKGLASLVQLLEEAQAAQKGGARLPVTGAVARERPVLPKSDVDVLPATSRLARSHAYAIVVGVQHYRNQLPEASLATQDAQIMGEYLIKVMGYAEENIVVLLNDRATKADVEKYVENWLPSRVEKDASVFIYFSGHGAPDPKTGEAYLVPYDGDPAFIEATGYPLKRLYEKVARLPAKDVVVMLDSCFSGAGGRSVIAKGMRPVGLSVENPVLATGRTVVLAASAENQVSSTYEKKGHGLLTYFFLKGLRGEADQNKDNAIDLAELFAYLKPQVESIARREFNHEQTPQLLGSPEILKRGVRLIESPKP